MRLSKNELAIEIVWRSDDEIEVCLVGAYDRDGVNNRVIRGVCCTDLQDARDEADEMQSRMKKKYKVELKIIY